MKTCPPGGVRMFGAVKKLINGRYITLKELRYTRGNTRAILADLEASLISEIGRSVESAVNVIFNPTRDKVKLEACIGITQYPERINAVLTALENYFEPKDAFTGVELQQEYAKAMVNVRNAFEALKSDMQSCEPAGMSLTEIVELVTEDFNTNPFDSSPRPLEDTYTEEVDKMSGLFESDTDEAILELSALVLKMGPAALWFQRSGQPIRIRDMSDSHLLNAINYLPKKPDYSINILWKTYSRVMMRELSRRDSSRSHGYQGEGDAPLRLERLEHKVDTVIQTIRTIPDLIQMRSDMCEKEEDLLKRAYDGLDDQGGR